MRNRYRRLGNWASFRARLLGMGLPVEVAGRALARVAEWPSRWLPSGAALVLSVVLTVVLPLIGAIFGVWAVWHPLTHAECGLWVIPALVSAALGGLAGMVIGLVIGFAATIALSVWSIRRRSGRRAG